MEKEALNEFVVEITEVLRSTKGFVIDQAPEVIQQALAFALWSEALRLIVSVLMVIVPVWGFYKYHKKHKESPFNSEDALPLALGVSGMVAMFFGLIMSGCSLSKLIKIWVAPKIYLIEYFESLIK